jgi:hypothetical protein
MGGEMSKASTLLDLIMADIRESNARNRWQRNQPRHRMNLGQLIRAISGHKKRTYRRDRVLRKLCDIQMKFMLKKVME